MKLIKITFFGTRPEEKEHLEHAFAKLPNFQATYIEEILDPERPPEKSDADIIAIFVDSKVNAAVLDSFPNLKLIAVRATGYDNIDFTETAKRGITVTNVPSYGENTVAEFAFGLILTLSRKMYTAADQVKETGSFSVEHLRGFDLQGKTIGVVGTGRIGRNSIRIAKGFGMNVVAYDPYPNDKLPGELGFKYVSFDELLADSDVITLHVPYSKETHHLMNEAAFSKMKKTAILINTSRGGIVDTSAIVKALHDKKIAGAGLDVLEEEGALKDEASYIAQNSKDEAGLRNLLADDVLMKMLNVIVTPHNAFNTDEALGRILDTTIENIKAWVDGKPINVVKG